MLICIITSFRRYITGSISWGLKRDDKEMMDVFFLIPGTPSKKMPSI